MAEHKACADIVALTSATADGGTKANDGSTANGELLTKPMCSLSVIKPNAAATATVDDSGTESGEEMNQKILVQVQGALANLESALPALDPLRRSSVVELLTKLQSSLKLSTPDANNNNNNNQKQNKPTPPPRKCWLNRSGGNNNNNKLKHDRHTVGVSSEELQDARRWLEENGYAGTTCASATSSASLDPKPLSACNTPRSYNADASTAAAANKTFRPVRFVPPPPKRTHYAEDYIPEPSKHSLHSGSFSVPPPQHGVVEDVLLHAATTTTSSSNGRRADDDDDDHCSSSSSSEPVSCTDDGDYDDEDDDTGVVPSSSSAQRLLQIASCSDLSGGGGGRFKFRQGKRAKLKRGAGGGGSDVCPEHSSGDEYPPQQTRSRSTQHHQQQQPAPPAAGLVPTFEPKTANDKKYLALLRQAKQDEAAAAAPTPQHAYNPLHGKLQGNWGNRFGRIKTTFEKNRQQQPAVVAVPRTVRDAQPQKKRAAAAKTFWHEVCKCPSDDNIVAQRPRKVAAAPSFSSRPAAVKQQQQQQPPAGFSHGVRSAFQPVAQKTAVQPVYAPAKPAYPKRLPLYNSSVTTAHRPFVPAVFASPPEEDDNNNKTLASCWPIMSPGGSGGGRSDWTRSRSESPKDDHHHLLQPSPVVVSRVMGSPQTASIVKSKTNHHHHHPQQQQLQQRLPLYPSPVAASPSSYVQPAVRQPQAPKPPVRSPQVMVAQQRSPTSSPVRMPSVLQKSESWHQMILGQSRAAVRSPLAPPPAPASSSFRPAHHRGGGTTTKDEIAQKQEMVRQRLRVGPAQTVPEALRRASPRLVKLNDDIDKVDDTFENLFKESTSRSTKSK